MQIIITGKGVKLTEPIEAYVNKKLGGIEKFFAGILRAEIVVGEETKHHVKGDNFFAEGKIEVPGREVFAKKTASTLYAAVDFLRDYLEGELKKHKAKLRGNEKKMRALGRGNKEYRD